MEQTTTDGFTHEIDFWKWFVKSDRFLHNWVFPEQNPEIRANHPDVAKCFDDFAAGWKDPRGITIVPDVLDIGSGALSWIKGIIPMNLIACDPLAEEYENIFDYDKYNQHPPIKVFAESIPFPDNSFDIVHCSNALDHTQNPHKAILEMERVCRPGGMILIQGVENEATKQGWKGLHQWNISLKTFEDAPLLGELMVSGKEKGFSHVPEGIFYANTRNIAQPGQPERNWFVFCYRNTK